MGNIVEAYQELEQKKNRFNEVKTPLSDKPAIKAYINRIGGKFVGQKRALIIERYGRYDHNKAEIKFNTKKGRIFCSNPEDAPTDDEREAIEKELAEVEMASCIPFPERHELPKEHVEFSRASNTMLYKFCGTQGEVYLYVLRVEKEDGGKYFIPLTFWDDQEYREEEPDEKLPIFGLDHIQNGVSRVFIHEGMKAAHMWHKLVTSNDVISRKDLKKHPFGEFLSTGAHIGWHGGALNPDRTDWSVLKKIGVKEIIIVADNDNVGRKAAYDISRLSGLKAKILQFTKDFPNGFDLADDLPSKLYAKNGTYIGPEIESMLHPATWAAYKNRELPPVRYKVNKAFIEEWNFIVEPQLFVHSDFPKRRYSSSEFNSMCRRFSDFSKVSDLHQDNRQREIQSLAYEPARKSGVFNIGEKTSFNVYTSSSVKTNSASDGPFLDFLDYLVPDDNDRKQVQRWIATLIAKPETRMAYGLLLISEMQGTGKTTLAERILSPLVGEHNVSFPNEKMITSEFNGWAGFKRLVLISEIYQGQAWKAYNILKSLITDKYIDVNEKHKVPVTIRNWAHILASSNSIRALKIDQDDRRWLIPKLTEVPWSLEKFQEFYSWLHGEGLGAIKAWAESFDDYVQSGEQAPMSGQKTQMIFESRSQFVKDAISLIEPRKEDNSPCVISVNVLIEAVTSHKGDKCYEEPKDFKRAFVSEGWFKHNDRISTTGKNHYVIYNAATKKLLSGKSSSEVKAILKEHLIADFQSKM